MFYSVDEVSVKQVLQMEREAWVVAVRGGWMVFDTEEEYQDYINKR